VTVVARVLAEAASRFGPSVALAPEGDAPVTYAELWEQAAAFAGSLRALGLSEGAVVGLDLPSDVSWVVAHAGVSALGGVAAGINPRSTPPEKAAVVERLAPDLVVTPDVLRDLPVGHAADLPPADPERVTTIVFTSGTTGEPKGATFRERHLDAIARLDTGSTDTWGGGPPMLVSTQFNHIGVSTKLAWYLRTGSRIHLLGRWRAADALRVTARERIPSVGGVAAHMSLMLRVPEFDSYDLSCVQTIVMGGAASPPDLVREARTRFGAAYSIRYSSTESGGVGTGTAFDADDEEALHTVGRPRPGVSVRVGDGGELQIQSPAVMDGYWRDPARTADAFTADGWLRTGDLATIDDRGLVRLTGRATDMYIRGGYNVHPAEVEAVLLEHPDVRAVAVVPRPDDVLGEVGVAVVVAARELPLDELRAFAAPRLATYKLPDAVVRVDELPLTTMDKVDRMELKRRQTA
jgi:acyl-CoA synthetase (AMP-forming)/AMP-acid ligase II